MFAFSYADVAALLGLKVKTVQKLAKKGAFEMTDLESVFSYWRKKIEKATSGDPAAAPDPALPYN